MSHRSDVHILLSILQSCNSTLAADVSLKTRLSYNQLKPKLETLIKSGYVKQDVEIRKRGKEYTVYMTTPKGHELIRTLDDIKEVFV